MTKRNPDQLIRAFLDEGRTELPDHAYETVRARIDQTRQRTGIGLWRTPSMTSITRVATGAAAVVLATVVGINLAPGGNGPGSVVATPSPTPAATTVTAQPLPTNGALDAGPYAGSIWVPTDTPVAAPTYTVEVPAGWATYEEGISQQAGEPPTGAFFRIWLLDRVRLYRDPCDVSLGLTDPVPPSVDALADALSDLDDRLVTPPTAVTIDGYAGKRLELAVPDDVVLSDCYAAQYRTWVQGASDYRYHQGPGQRDRLWILDVEGQRIVINAAYFPGTSPATVQELNEMVESIRFHP